MLLTAEESQEDAYEHVIKVKRTIYMVDKMTGYVCLCSNTDNKVVHS